MERSLEALRHSQAKVSELEKTNKKLYLQTHDDRRAIIKLREVSISMAGLLYLVTLFSPHTQEVEMLKVKVSMLWSLLLVS